MVALCQQEALYTKLFVSIPSFRNLMMPASEWRTYRVIALESYVPLTSLRGILGPKLINNNLVFSKIICFVSSFLDFVLQMENELYDKSYIPQKD